MMKNWLPNSDPDLQLACRIGQHLNDRSALSDTEDALMPLLLNYRQSFHAASEQIRVPSSDLWKGIQEKTQPRTPVYWLWGRSARRTAWTAAAIILLAALTGVFFFYSQINHPSLLAQSQANIKKITLADGSNVTLRPYSKLYEIRRTNTEALYSLSGEAFFDVVTNPQREFNVTAGKARVTVLGTHFDLSSWGEATQVFLERGSIKFTNLKNKRAVVLQPGQSSMIAKTTEVPVIRQEDAAAFTDWINQKLIFTNKPASYVFDEVEQEFSIDISAPQPVLQTRISSGGLALENIDSTLENLGLVLGGTFEARGKNTFRFIPKH